MHGRSETASPVVVARHDGPYGEVVLRRHGRHYEIIANGCFLMDTSDGRSERLLVDAALDALTTRGETHCQTHRTTQRQTHRGARSETPRERHHETRPALLIGGLGVGFSLARAVAEPRWGDITVVEREAAVVAWHRSGPLSAFSAQALDDPRVRVVQGDLVAYVHEAAATYDALCLDIDNGPDWTVTENNGSLYSPSGLTACRERLNPGGVLAVWSARPSAEFEAALRGAEFASVRTVEVPVTRGVPDAVHLAVKACTQAS